MRRQHKYSVNVHMKHGNRQNVISEGFWLWRGRWCLTVWYISETADCWITEKPHIRAEVLEAEMQNGKMNSEISLADRKAVVTWINTLYIIGGQKAMQNTKLNLEVDGIQQQKTTFGSTSVNQEQKAKAAVGTCFLKVVIWWVWVGDITGRVGDNPVFWIFNSAEAHRC